MARQSDVAIGGDAHRGSVESAQRDAGFVERRDAGEDGGAQVGRGGWCKRSA
jgi:hypothetical protein